MRSCREDEKCEVLLLFPSPSTEKSRTSKIASWRIIIYANEFYGLCDAIYIIYYYYTYIVIHYIIIICRRFRWLWRISTPRTSVNHNIAARNVYDAESPRNRVSSSSLKRLKRYWRTVWRSWTSSRHNTAYLSKNLLLLYKLCYCIDIIILHRVHHSQRTSFVRLLWHNNLEKKSLFN